MIIPFGWWHQEHPISNIADPKSWNFTDNNCKAHLLPEDEGISIEWEEDVLNDPNAVTIGRIEQVDNEKRTILEKLPEVYYDYLCYGGSNIQKTSEYTRPVRLGV